MVVYDRAVVRWYRALFIRLGRTRWFSWLSYRILVPIDRLVYTRTGGRFSLLHFGARRKPALQSLLLTTTGRKTGQPRTTPVLYLSQEGRSLVVVASNFGREHHPAWSYNLLADAEASVQVRDRSWDVRARLASEEEQRGLWPRLLELYPTWEDYTERTDRSFRAFFLDPR